MLLHRIQHTNTLEGTPIIDSKEDMATNVEEIVKVLVEAVHPVI